MSRAFTVTLSYREPPSTVHEALTTEQLWRDMFARTETATVDIAAPDGPGTIRVQMHERVGKDRVPGVVRKVLKDELTLTRTDDWQQLHDDAAHGTLTAHSTGIDGTINGGFELRAADGGTEVRVTGEVTVKIKFVGGAIEALAVQSFTKLLQHEQRFVEKWLADKG